MWPENLKSLSYTYRMVSRVFRIPFREGVAPEKGILNMSDIILYAIYLVLYHGSQSALSILSSTQLLSGC